MIDWVIIVVGLALLFKSTAERMALCKAFIKEGGTAMTVLSKLCMGVHEDGKHVSFYVILVGSCMLFFDMFRH